MADRLDLGVGIVALAGLDLCWPEIADLVDVVEVEPQTLWDEAAEGWVPDQAAYEWLGGLDRPVLAHGVGFPVGGQHPLDARGVELFARCCARLEVHHASEHLSFNRCVSGATSLHAGFLLPPRQNWETIDAAVAHIGDYQRVVGAPFLVESGVSYLQATEDELDDAAFLREIVERADCGLLLDLHNLWANERNGRQPVAQVLAGLPLDRVHEVHVAGGFELDGYWLDAHSGPCDRELERILEASLPLLPNVRAVIFEALPTHLVAMGASGVRAQLERLHRIVDRTRREPVRAAKRPTGVDGRRPSPRPPSTSEASWQRDVIAYTTRRASAAPSTDPGYAILRTLTDHARLGRVAVGATSTLADLHRRFGAEGVQTLAERYLDACDAQVWTCAEAAAFTEWVDGQVATVPSS